MYIQRQSEAFAYRVATKPKSFDYTLVDRLEQEFNDWATKNNITNPSDLPWAPRGPIGHWPNIENFLKTNYPASYRNLAMGDELTRPLLDRGGTPKYRADPLGSPPRANPDEEASQQPYETGPDAVAQHGYDPKEVAAAMLLLHDDSHIGRTLLKRDQNRLFDIVKKRHQMQEAYDQAHIAIRLAENTIRCASDDLQFEHDQENNTLNAYIQGNFAGQISWEPDGEINGVMVWPEYQRKGIAR